MLILICIFIRQTKNPFGNKSLLGLKRLSLCISFYCNLMYFVTCHVFYCISNNSFKFKFCMYFLYDVHEETQIKSYIFFFNVFVGIHYRWWRLIPFQLYLNQEKAACVRCRLRPLENLHFMTLM